MIKFNASGLLIPSSPIISTLAEFEEHFAVDSPQNGRRILFNQFINYAADLKTICGKDEMKQWIDGSYVTKKYDPFDIDLVTFIDYQIAENKEKEIKEFIYPASLAKYGIDGYVIVMYPENHVLHFAYRADCSYWINHFDKTKPNKRHKTLSKGFIEIIV